jgi:hypothetical protein
MECDWPCYAVQLLPNGNWLLRAPTGDPVGPRVAIVAVVGKLQRFAICYGAPSGAPAHQRQRQGEC